MIPTPDEHWHADELHRSRTKSWSAPSPMLDEYDDSQRSRATTIYQYLSDDATVPPALSLTIHAPPMLRSQPSAEHAQSWPSQGPSTGLTTDSDTLNSSYSAPDRHDYFGSAAGDSMDEKPRPARLPRLTKKMAASMTKDELSQWHEQRAAQRREKRRKMHNRVERKRRDFINDCLTELAQTLPSTMLAEALQASTAGAASQPVNLASPAADLSLGRHVFQLVSTVDADKNAKMLAEAKPNKSIILTSAIQYITDLQDLVERQAEACAALEYQLRALDSNSVAPHLAQPTSMQYPPNPRM